MIVILCHDASGTRLNARMTVRLAYTSRVTAERPSDMPRKSDAWAKSINPEGNLSERIWDDVPTSLFGTLGPIRSEPPADELEYSQVDMMECQLGSTYCSWTPIVDSHRNILGISHICARFCRALFCCAYHIALCGFILFIFPYSSSCFTCTSAFIPREETPKAMGI